MTKSSDQQIIGHWDLDIEIYKSLEDLLKATITINSKKLV